MASSKKVVKAAKLAKTKGKPAAKQATQKVGDKAAKGGGSRTSSRSPDVAKADAALFDPLTPGETADALRQRIRHLRPVEAPLPIAHEGAGRVHAVCAVEAEEILPRHDRG